MTYKLRYIGIGLTIAAIFVTAMSLFYVAKASPSYFIRANGGPGCTLTATTSVTYITPGTATSTYYFDTSCGGASNTDSATLLAQFAGSSTASVLNIALEYAQGGGADCTATPTACDWYQANNATLGTSSAATITNQQSYTWTFSSSTQGQVTGTGPNTGRTLKSLNVPTPAKYVRAIFSMPTGSLNGAVWSEFVGKRQSN